MVEVGSRECNMDGRKKCGSTDNDSLWTQWRWALTPLRLHLHSHLHTTPNRTPLDYASNDTSSLLIGGVDGRDRDAEVGGVVFGVVTEKHNAVIRTHTLL